MKNLINGLCALVVLMSVAAPASANEIAEQTCGGVSYYVLNDTKTLLVELPYVVTIALTKLTSSFGLTVLGRLDVDHERPEIPDLKAKYPGFQIQYMGPDSFKNITLDLGIQRSVQGFLPPAGADSFTVLDKLTLDEGNTILSNVAAGHGPQIKIEIAGKKPTRIKTAEVNYDLGQMCSNLQSVAHKQTLGGAIAALAVAAKDVLSVKSDKLRESAADFILSQCVSITGDDSSDSVPRILAKPIKFLQPTGHISATDFRVDYVPAEKTWNSSTKVVSQ